MGGMLQKLSNAKTSLYPAAIIMCSFFLLGVTAGGIAAAYGEASEVTVAAAQPDSLISTIITLAKYPTLALLFGLSVAGVVAIPALMTLRGFLLSFAVSAITRSMGAAGVVAALSVFWVHILVVFPCLVFLSSQGFVSSSGLISASRGRQGFTYPVFDRAFIFRSSVCMVVLLVAAVLEKLVTPALTSFALRFITAG